MATITGLTADRMLEIEASSIVDGEVVGGNLFLTKHDGTTINAGSVVGPAGPAGPAGPSLSAIPGEIKMWSGSTLPVVGTYGKWVWADGAVYSAATYPIAAGHISTAWKTFAGASDPGAGNFRVPDLRGLVPVGLDQMPGGSRANRMTRAVAITLAGKTGEETHVITVAEMPVHDHGIILPYQNTTPGTEIALRRDTGIAGNTSPYITTPVGGGSAHENVQPTVFVPYIVKLDG